MFKRYGIVVAVIALLMLAIIPAAGADPVQKDAFIVAECPDSGNPQNAGEFKVWFPTEDKIQIRGAENLYHEYLYTDAGWAAEPFGTNLTTASVSAAYPSFEGQFGGTFDFIDEAGVGIGDAAGSWVVNSGAARASGKTVDGRVVKVTLGLAAPAPPFPGCGVVEFLVMDNAN